MGNTRDDRRTIAVMGGMEISIEESFGKQIVCIDFENGDDAVHMRLPAETADQFGEAISEAAHTARFKQCESHEVWKPYRDIGRLGPVKYETSDHGRVRRVSDHSIVRPSGFLGGDVVYHHRGGGSLELRVKRGCMCLAQFTVSGPGNPPEYLE